MRSEIFFMVVWLIFWTGVSELRAATPAIINTTSFASSLTVRSALMKNIAQPVVPVITDQGQDDAGSDSCLNQLECQHSTVNLIRPILQSTTLPRLVFRSKQTSTL